MKKMQINSEALAMNNIEYNEKKIEVLSCPCKCRAYIGYKSLEDVLVRFFKYALPVISDQPVDNIDVSP